MLGTLGFSPYIFPMSRAFVKDDDGGESGQDLPDRLISEHPNLVTLKGMEQIGRPGGRMRKGNEKEQGSHVVGGTHSPNWMLLLFQDLGAGTKVFPCLTVLGVSSRLE